MKESRGLAAERARRLPAARAAATRRAARLAELKRLREEDDWATMDPDDRLCMQAHGFGLADDWNDPAVMCRNGCGASYGDVVAGKRRECLAAG